jgi:hypothetical protein
MEPHLPAERPSPEPPRQQHGDLTRRSADKEPVAARDIIHILDDSTVTISAVSQSEGRVAERTAERLGCGRQERVCSDGSMSLADPGDDDGFDEGQDHQCVQYQIGVRS